MEKKNGVTWNNHHIFFEKADFRRAKGAAKTLMHLTTVLIPQKEVHCVIHREVPPMDTPTPELANEMLKAARSVHERGIDRLDAIITELGILGSDESEYYLENLLAQRTLMDVAYPREEIA